MPRLVFQMSRIPTMSAVKLTFGKFKLLECGFMANYKNMRNDFDNFLEKFGSILA